MSWKTLIEGCPAQGPVIIAYRPDHKIGSEPEIIGAYYMGRHVGRHSFVDSLNSGYPFWEREIVAWHPMPSWPPASAAPDSAPL